MIFVRVKDPGTGHEFDLPETDPRIASGAVKRVAKAHYPSSTVARRPKHYVGVNAAPASTPTAADGAAEKEATNG